MVDDTDADYQFINRKANMKKYIAGLLGALIAVVGVLGAHHAAHAYTWCFAQTTGGVTTYSENYIYDFGSSGGVMRCTDSGWISSPGAVPSTQVGASGTTSMTISWPGMAGVSAYTLIIAETPDFVLPAYVQSVAGTSWAVTGLKPNTNYYYHVYGTTVTGAKTPYSSTLWFKTSVPGTATVSPATRWVNSSGDRVIPSAIHVDFTDGNGDMIFPESSWNTFGPDR
jgi:hypothetical protein